MTDQGPSPDQPALPESSSSTETEGRPSLVEVVRHLMSHDAHPLVQFIKYGVAGGIATLTFIGVFALVTTYWFPVVEDSSRFNYTIASVMAFIPSNVVAYLTNILWVFKSGRHNRLQEIMYFLAASTLAFCIGTPLGQWMVIEFELLGLLRYVALGASIVASVLVNYACRKFLIFRG